MGEDLVPLALIDVRQNAIYRLRGGTSLVGRSSDCWVILPSEAVSRRHAELTVSDREVRVRDLGSRNGTFINDKSVGDGVVAIGDRLKFGSTTLTLQHVDGIREIEEPETRRDPHEGRLSVAERHERLTEAQKRVFRLLIQGKSEKEVANALHLSQNTVHSHVQAIYAVFEVHTRPQLIALVLKEGWDPGDGL